MLLNNSIHKKALLCTTDIWFKMAAVLSGQSAVLCGILFARDYTFFELRLRVPIPDICPRSRMLQGGSLGLVIKQTHKSPLVLQRIHRHKKGNYYSASGSCTEQTHYLPVMKDFCADKGCSLYGGMF